MSAGAGVDEIEIMKAVFLSSTELMHRSLHRSCECARVYSQHACAREFVYISVRACLCTSYAFLLTALHSVSR